VSQRDLGPRRDGPGQDRGQHDGPTIPDQTPWPDLKPAWDIVPWPDSTPWQCVTDQDCDDSHPCTQDTCSPTKQCLNTLLADHCLIGTTCFVKDQIDTNNSCTSCQPAVSTNTWTLRADGSLCTADPLGCTDDICKAGVCTHPLAAGTCLINGSCYAGGDADPASPCRLCKPSDSTSQWTDAANGTPCPADQHSCTQDHCQAGVCTHPVDAGWCLIGGSCYQEGKSAGSDYCNECVAAATQTAWTFVAGKQCYSGPGLARMCFNNQCRGWTQSTYEPVLSPAPESTALNGVDYIAAAGGVWAAGEYQPNNSSAPQGLLTPLGPSSVTTQVLTEAPLRGIHYRLAVGDQGQAWYHDGNKWTDAAVLSAWLKGVDRNAVYGTSMLGGAEVFHLTGPHDSSMGGVAGVVRCIRSGIGIVACSNQSSFASTAILGGVFATQTALGLQGPAWAMTVDGIGDEPDDIYATPGPGSSWSRNPPLGCQDAGSSPCANTSGSFRDMYGSSDADIWVVGSYGNMLHHDGTGWSRLSNKFSLQTYQVMTAVYSSPGDKLVSIASYRATSSWRWVSLTNYNVALDRWFGPITVVSGSDNGIDEIRDIGGTGYGNLWMVGTREVGSGGSAKAKGWILHLQ